MATLRNAQQQVALHDARVSLVVPQVVASRADTLVLAFQPPSLVSAAAQAVAGFSLCGTQAGSCVAAKAVQQGSRIEIERAVLPAATRLRYGWSDGGICELKSLGGLTVGSVELPLAAPRK